MTTAILSKPAHVAVSVRDPRLDMFRGLGMLIILVAHIPGNTWTLWIPARFGFSDATEMFVFLSGMASAIAFGGTFDRKGAGMLFARVAQRIWQLWWVHVCLFVAIFAMMIWAGNTNTDQPYFYTLNLQRFVADPGLILDFLRLSYVPNYFDILPMYIVILALMPVMLLAERVHGALPFAIMAGLWLIAQSHMLQFPAEPWSDRTWFFDPLGWQLLFYLGFFLRRGTCPAPKAEGWVLKLAIAVVILTVPFAWFRALEAVPFLKSAAVLIHPLTDKSAFGILRLVHFLSLAIICVRLAGPEGVNLSYPAIAPVTEILRCVGQQSLAIFVSSMFLAQALGIVLDHTGRNFGTTALINLSGFAIAIAIAMVIRWFKSTPWKERRT
ncbi:OpgC family protein [Falsirhodobacter sp. alg1]|uniref:OpgC family protein n=1 Tax=Falsirhodobacter sp. alg1 TaxID=1472418 RepID=UPI0009EB17F2|nr:OpgC domain-containing protein [Falsirhodobacter sp. alg1]